MEHSNMNLLSGRHKAADFFFLRAPLLPLATVESVATAVSAGSPSSVTPESPALSADASADVAIQDLLNRPEAIEALYVAAPEFLETLGRGPRASWWANPRRRARVVAAARRYLIRMTYRPTPFGLFAGCSLGTVGEGTTLHVAPSSMLRRHIRLDAQIVFQLSARLLADMDLVLLLPVTPNTTLYEVGDEWRFIERHSDGSRYYAFALGAVQRNAAVDSIITRSSHDLPARLHVESLCGQGYAVDEARDFVLSLIRSQVLVSALLPSVVGSDLLTRLHDLLAVYAPESRWRVLVGNVRAAIEDANRALPSDGLRRYHVVEAHLRTVGVSLTPGQTFQVDLYREGPPPVVSRKLTEDILAGVVALQALSDRSALQRLVANVREAFNRRYGDRDVPLLHLFDPSLGLNPALFNSGAASIEAAQQLAGIKRHASELPSLSPGQLFLLRQHASVAIERGHEIVITAQDVERLAAESMQTLPDTFSVLVSLFRTGPHSRRSDGAEVVTLLRSLVGGSAAKFLGRFMHGHEDLRDKVRRLVAGEQARRADALLAEVNCALGPRSPNVSQRPHMGQLEITLLGPRDESDGAALSLRDLFVRIDDGRLMLWSERMDQRIVPRFASMHGVNPRRDLPIYTFLLALQAEDGMDYAGTESLWGPLANLAWLPRVSFANTILARETWSLAPTDIGRLSSGATDRLRALLRRRSVPALVVLAEDDHELPLDLRSDWGLEAVLSAMRRGRPVRLYESLSAEFSPVAVGPEGQYNNELMIPYVRPDQAQQPTGAVRARATAKHLYCERRFPPGTEWVYIKAYTSPAAVDRVLIDALGPACRRLQHEQLIDGWFFLRYADSSEHVRLRLRCRNIANWSAVHQCVMKALDDAQAFADLRAELGTYEPETRRYGGDRAMRLTEDLFHFDSEMVLDLLTDAHNQAGHGQRFLTHTIVMDRLLESLLFDHDEREVIVHYALERYSSATPAALTKEAAVVCGDLHRSVGNELRRQMESSGTDSASNSALSGSVRWLNNVRALAPQLRETLASAGVATPQEWAMDVLHMHCNRGFGTHIVEQEYLAYALLARYYRARRERRTSRQIGRATTAFGD